MFPSTTANLCFSFCWNSPYWFWFSMFVNFTGMSIVDWPCFVKLKADFRRASPLRLGFNWFMARLYFQSFVCEFDWPYHLRDYLTISQMSPACCFAETYFFKIRLRPRCFLMLKQGSSFRHHWNKYLYVWVGITKNRYSHYSNKFEHKVCQFSGWKVHLKPSNNNNNLNNDEMYLTY